MGGGNLPPDPCHLCSKQRQICKLFLWPPNQKYRNDGLICHSIIRWLDAKVVHLHSVRKTRAKALVRFTQNDWRDGKMFSPLWYSHINHVITKRKEFALRKVQICLTQRCVFVMGLLYPDVK